MLDAGMAMPPGPVSAEALTFTFVNPFVGPWTMTCVSTVSPRAPETEMAETAPVASAGPTLVRLDMTHTGNAEACWTPLPVRVMAAGEFVALLPTDMLPGALPGFGGANPTFSVAD